MIQIHPTYDGGFANSHGIIFSSINSHGPINQPVPIAPSHIPKPQQSDSSLQSSNINNILDFNSNYSLFNPAPSQVQEVPAKPPSSFSPSGFTFAPLLIASSLPMPTRPTKVNSTSNQMNLISQMVQGVNLKPSSSTVPSSTTQQQSPISSSSLKSQCGITNYTSSRVVGGTITQVGEYFFR